MAGQTGPSDPSGREPVDKVRYLQRRLWAAAKRSPGRRFHALLDRIYRRDVLEEAWKRVRANRGAAGVDRKTVADVEAYGVERMLDELQAQLRAGTYRPAPVRRQAIPKPGGGMRPLGIPTVRDRVAQQAAKLVLEPIFEADFLPSSYGYRPKRSATEALERIRVGFNRGYAWVVEFDIRGYFDSIEHERLLRMVEQRLSDRRVVKLVRLWLKAGVLENGQTRETVTGTPQGGVISPLLANIYLHELDQRWAEQGIGELVRYADDGVVLCKSQAEAETVIRDINPVLRGWGTYFRTGNAATKFIQIDTYVWRRLHHFLVKRQGRNLRPGQADRWTSDWLYSQGLYRLRGTIRYPEVRNRA